MGDIASERFRSGNHCRVYFTGAGAEKLLGEGRLGGPLGKGTGANMATSLGVRPVHTLGDPEPQDLVDGLHTYTVRVDMLMLRDENAAQLIQAEPVRIDIVDRYNNKLVAVAENCKLTEGNLSVQAGNLLARNLSFQATRIK